MCMSKFLRTVTKEKRKMLGTSCCPAWLWREGKWGACKEEGVEWWHEMEEGEGGGSCGQ